MNIRCIAIAFFALSTAACATAFTPGESVADINSGDFIALGHQVEFDYACASDRIRVIRGAYIAFDLDVCGAVRRYKYVGRTWLDVTTLYPASALPAPLPPK